MKKKKKGFNVLLEIVQHLAKKQLLRQIDSFLTLQLEPTEYQLRHACT